MKTHTTRLHPVLWMVIGYFGLSAFFSIISSGFNYLGSQYSNVAPQTLSDLANRPPDETTSPVEETPKLKISKSDWNWYTQYNSVAIAEGRVKNISGEPLDGVEVVVTWLSKTGEYITSNSTLIDFQPIDAGKSSPWKVIAQYVPGISTAKAKVEFKYFNGGEIKTKRD